LKWHAAAPNERLIDQFLTRLWTHNIYGFLNAPEKPTRKAGVADDRVATPERSAQVVPLPRQGIPDQQPDRLSEAEAMKIVRLLASDSDNIVIIPYGKRRTRQRKITRPQVEKCVRPGTIQEGPFLKSARALANEPFFDMPLGSK